MAKNVCAFLAVVFLGVSVSAEYRVFLLKIEKRRPASAQEAADSAAAPARFLESTLDPEQYRGYYPVADDEQVTYVDTWRCRGRTDHRPLCPNPRGPAAIPGE